MFTQGQQKQITDFDQSLIIRTSENNNELKKLLLLKQQSLLEEIESLQHTIRIPREEEDGDGEVHRKRLSMHKRDFLNIDKALVKIKSNTYGECDICHEPISQKRLSAQPSTTLCINCQVEFEISQNSMFMQ